MQFVVCKSLNCCEIKSSRIEKCHLIFMSRNYLQYKKELYLALVSEDAAPLKSLITKGYWFPHSDQDNESLCLLHSRRE